MSKLVTSYIARVAADYFPFSGGAEIEEANEKRASKGARLWWAKKLRRSREGVSKPHPLPVLLILPLLRSFPPIRKRLEKERKRLLCRLLVTLKKEKQIHATEPERWMWLNLCLCPLLWDLNLVYFYGHSHYKSRQYAKIFNPQVEEGLTCNVLLSHKTDNWSRGDNTHP